jgi:hypothetical protein
MTHFSMTLFGCCMRNVSSSSLRRILQPDINSQAGAEILHHSEGPESTPN